MVLKAKRNIQLVNGRTSVVLETAIRVVVVIYYRTLAHEQQQFSGATPSLSQLNAPDRELPPISLLPIVLKSFRKGL